MAIKPDNLGYRAEAESQSITAQNIRALLREHKQEHQKLYLTTTTVQVEPSIKTALLRSCLPHNIKTTEENDIGEIPQSPNSQQTDLIEFLGLNRFTISQMSVQDARSVLLIKEDKSLTGPDLPWLLLYHLMRNNYKWRDEIQQHIPNENEGKMEKHLNSASGLEANIPSDNDFDSFLNDVELSSDSLSTKVIHPNDILLNTIILCNLELKQVLFQKLLMCKQSIPFIYRIPGREIPCYSIFPLRSMPMECRTKEGATLLCAATMNTKVIAFIRIGQPSQSKSKLLNNILSEQKHATFCHRDDTDENTKPLNAKGLIEAAWYLPSGKLSDPFEEVLTFLNLRGDAARLPKEIAITGRIASAIVTLIDTSCLANADTIATTRNLCLNSANIVVVLTNSLGVVPADKLKYDLRQCFPSPGGKVKIVQAFNWSTKHLKPEVTLRKEIIGAMIQVIKVKEYISLSKCGTSLAQDKLVFLDENTDDAFEGKLLAKEIFSGLCCADESEQFLKNDIDSVPNVFSKEDHLPLQGKLWKRWSQLSKKQHKNKGGNDIYELQGTIQKKMDQIRQKQAQQCSHLNQSMACFLKYLFKANDKSTGYPNFLLWLKLILNENSRNVLPRLFTDFRQCWEKLREAKDKNASANDITCLQKAAEQAEIKLATASFGLEHYMRELGQLYECALLSNNPLTDIVYKQKLPEIIADLLLKGEAFEIMDGDAANIPINWVKEVLKRLRDKIGNKTLFIISVLGIQSSGKSTLLNALFGLQFTVSAGRCTRGVFGQLVPVQKRHNLPYDYILVVDTEGLRAPELGQIHLDHDNELATFVIGIGDVALINIKGENTAEIKDVLQITVQAFLRMKLANDKMELKRKCIFIHQNVGAVNAAEQMMQGLKKFQENLDIMTKNAAEEENMRHIQSFSQVIDFQGQKHVLYFPDLWHGDPPMAPSNPGYSLKIMELLERLEQIAINGGAHTTVNGLIHRIDDLWKGIMAENFVFSFRNTLEIKAYNSMDSKYQQLCGDYGRFLMEWFEKEASIDIELCNTLDSLRQCCEKLKNTLRVKFLQRKEDIEKQLVKYFDKNELDYILIQWKNSRVLKFHHMAEAVERNTLEYIEQKEEEQRIAILSKSTDMKLEEAINAKAKILAEAYRGKTVDTTELETTFDTVWIEWTKEYVGTKSSCMQPETIQDMLVFSLFDRLEKNQMLLKKELLQDNLGQYRLKKINISCLEKSWGPEDVNLKHTNFTFPNMFRSNDVLKQQAIKYTDNVFRKLDIEFENLMKKDIQIRNEHANDIIHKTVHFFEKENKDPDHILTFKPTYETKLVVHVCSYAFMRFNEMAVRYEKKHGVNGKLEAYKATAKHLFLNTVKSKSYEFVSADFFCDRVKERIRVTIEATVPRQIVENVMQHFCHSKYHVMLAVMEDLAKKKDFPAFIQYIQDSKSSVHTWMDQFINKAIFEAKGASMSKYLEFVSTRLNRIVKCIKEAIVAITEEVTTERGNWAQLFESNVKTELAVPSHLLDYVTKKITDVQHFKELLLPVVDELEKQVLNEFRSCDPETIVWKGTSPNETIMNDIWGCPEECPFCSEPCQRSKGHLSDGVSHSCIQHRPVGVDGTFSMTDNKLVIEPCNFNVQSSALFHCNVCKLKCRESGKCKQSGTENVKHRYKHYKTFLPDWDIAPNPTMEVSKYWMWFVGKYIDDLVKYYSVEKPNVPESWKAISDKDALDSLRVAID